MICGFIDCVITQLIIFAEAIVEEGGIQVHVGVCAGYVSLRSHMSNLTMLKHTFCGPSVRVK